MSEIWRTIPSFSDYEASSLGRIRRLTPRLIDNRWADNVLKLRKAKGREYLIVTLMKPKTALATGINRWTPCRVNRLVCEAFAGPAPADKPQCAHIDGDPSNNRASNLIWTSPAENTRHKWVHGTMLFGDKDPKAKLTSAKVAEITERRRGGETWQSLAERMGVSVRTVRNAFDGHSWKRA